MSEPAFLYAGQPSVLGATRECFQKVTDINQDRWQPRPINEGERLTGDREGP